MKDILGYLIAGFFTSLLLWLSLVVFQFALARVYGRKPRYLLVSIPVMWAALTLAGILFRLENQTLAVLFVVIAVFFLICIIFWALSLTLYYETAKNVLEFALYVGITLFWTVIAIQEIGVARYVFQHPRVFDSPDTVIFNFGAVIGLVLLAKYWVPLLIGLAIIAIYFLIAGSKSARRNVAWWFVLLFSTVLLNWVLSDFRIVQVYARAILHTVLALLPIIYFGILLKKVLKAPNTALNPDAQKQRAG